MDNFNKVISFVLGLIVVVVFLAIVTRRIDLKNKISIFNFGAKLSVTPTPQTQGTKTEIVPTGQAGSNRYQVTPPTAMKQQAKSIPSTGPELLFPLALSSLLGGLFLKKRVEK